MSASSKLLTNFALGDLELSNRVVMAPLTRGRAVDNAVPNELMAEYYAQRASAGLIISEATAISIQGYGWLDSPGIYRDEMLRGWEKVVSGVHDAGGKMFLQLWHTGRASHSDFGNGELPVAPSPIAIPDDEIRTPQGKKPYETPRALEVAEIPSVLADYREAAANAMKVGFDGVEIHSANGYLLDSFLQSKTNHRDDAYGGSIENRFRLLGEVVATVCDVVPSNRVGVRLSPNGAFNGMGSKDYREQFLYVASQLDQCDLCYLHVMNGLGFGFHELGEPMTLEEFRSVFNGPLMGNVGYTQQTAEADIAAGKADLIAFGRPFISNPDLVERFIHGVDLNPEAPMSTWYTADGEKGYTDFPTAEIEPRDIAQQNHQ